MENTREPARQLIAGTLKKLVIEKDFSKLTIKRITAEAGLIRPTFYRHFQDKCDVLSYIMDTELLPEAKKLLEQGKFEEAVAAVFKAAGEDRAFYRKAFLITGQNGFQETLTEKLADMLSEHLRRVDRSPRQENPLLSDEWVAHRYALDMTNFLKRFLLSPVSERDFDQGARAYLYLLGNSAFHWFK